MNRIRLGQTDLHVSTLCFGTDLVGTRIDYPTSYALLDSFVDAGGTFIDTGNFYAAWLPGCVGGESETAIGSWMQARGHRNRLTIATKLGFDYPGCGGGLSAVEIERECEKSLGRLQTDRIDLYYAHRDDPQTPIDETLEAFDRLIRSGKVRAVGASNLPVWRIAEANTICRLRGWNAYCVVEQRHTYLRPRHGADFGPQIPINEDLKAYCRREGMALIAYSILLQGAYTRPDRPIPAQYAGPDAAERMEVLKAVAAEIGATPNQVIIAWMLRGDPPILPIVAASRLEQLAEDIAGLRVELSADQVRRLDTAGNPDIKQAWLH